MIKPWSVQLEVTEGCNFRCWFCGIHAIRGKKQEWKFMDPEGIVRPAAKELDKWIGNPRFELNNHGEPTTNPHYFDIIRILREECPSCHIQTQTNGYAAFPMLDESNDFDQHIIEFFAAGGNLLALNCYRKGFYEYAMDRCKTILAEHRLTFELVDFYFDNPGNLSAYRNYGSKSRKVFVFQDLGLANEEKLANKRLAKKILNEAGNSPAAALEKKLDVKPIADPLKKACSRVFRELTIGWNGVIPACCYDWKNELVFGKFPEQSLQEIFYGNYWKAARVLLHPMFKERDMEPCDKCDYNGGFRLGLLPAPDSGMDVGEAYSAIVDAHAEFERFKFKGSRE